MKAVLALLALGALYMLGRSLGRTLGPAPAPEPDEYVPMAAWLPEPDAYRYGATLNVRN